MPRGTRIKNVGAGADFVLKAHDLTPEWDKKRNTIASASRAAFQKIGLHFHDLRRGRLRG